MGDAAVVQVSIGLRLGPWIGVEKGSVADLMVRTSSRGDDARPKDVQSAAAIHLPLHQLELGDMPLGLAVGPRQSDCRDDGILVLDHPIGEGCHQ